MTQSIKTKWWPSLQKLDGPDTVRVKAKLWAINDSLPKPTRGHSDNPTKHKQIP